MKKSIKILCIGNSFSHDTTRFVPQIALSCGYDEIVIAETIVVGEVPGAYASTQSEMVE